MHFCLRVFGSLHAALNPLTGCWQEGALQAGEGEGAQDVEAPLRERAATFLPIDVTGVLDHGNSFSGVGREGDAIPSLGDSSNF